MKKYILFLCVVMGCAGAYATPEQAHKHVMDKALGQAQHTETIRIAVLVYPEVVLQDMAGPMEVFSKAKNLSNGKYETYTVALSEGAIETENGQLKIKPDYVFGNVPDADYLLIPGANMPVINKLVDGHTYADFIRKWGQQDDSSVVSICTGSYLLADTGLLNGYRATTHFFVADDFSEQYPEVNLVRDVRFVDAGKYITSSGVTSGIDAALHIVDKHSGSTMRKMIARALQYRFHQEEDWPVSPHGMKYRR